MSRSVTLRFQHYCFILALTTVTLLVSLNLVYAFVIITAAYLLIFVFARPLLGILAIAIMVASIISYDVFPLIPIGIGSLHPSDIILLTLVSLLLYRRLSGHTYAATPLNKPLFLFLISALLTAVLSTLYFGLPFNIVMQALRPISYYMLFFLVVNFVCDSKHIHRLTLALFILSTIVSVAMLAQVAVGTSFILIAGRVENAATFDRFFDTLRVLPPGAIVVFVSLITAISFATHDPHTPLLQSKYFYLFSLFTLAVIVTYNRNYWTAAFIALGLLLISTNAHVRKRLLLLTIATLLVAGVLAGLIGNHDNTPRGITSAVKERVTSMFSGSTLLKSGSLEYRLMENRYALEQIATHPLIGIGLGNSYRPSLFGKDDFNTTYIHNGYLWIIMNMGLGGFLLFMWFLLGFILRGIRYWKTIGDITLRSTLIGLALSGLGILLIALVSPVIMEWHGVVVLSIIAGLSEAIIVLNSQGRDATHSDTIRAGVQLYARQSGETQRTINKWNSQK